MAALGGKRAAAAPVTKMEATTTQAMKPPSVPDGYPLVHFLHCRTCAACAWSSKECLSVLCEEAMDGGGGGEKDWREAGGGRKDPEERAVRSWPHKIDDETPPSTRVSLHYR